MYCANSKIGYFNLVVIFDFVLVPYLLLLFQYYPSPNTFTMAFGIFQSSSLLKAQGQLFQALLFLLLCGIFVCLDEFLLDSNFI